MIKWHLQPSSGWGKQTLPGSPKPKVTVSLPSLVLESQVRMTGSAVRWPVCLSYVHGTNGITHVSARAGLCCSTLCLRINHAITSTRVLFTCIAEWLRHHMSTPWFIQPPHCWWTPGWFLVWGRDKQGHSEQPYTSVLIHTGTGFSTACNKKGHCWVNGYVRHTVFQSPCTDLHQIFFTSQHFTSVHIQEHRLRWHFHNLTAAGVTTEHWQQRENRRSESGSRC